MNPDDMGGQAAAIAAAFSLLIGVIVVIALLIFL